jgi:hypothetical protein
MTVSGVSFMSGRKARKSWCGPELVHPRHGPAARVRPDLDGAGAGWLLKPGRRWGGLGD